MVDLVPLNHVSTWCGALLCYGIMFIFYFGNCLDCVRLFSKHCTEQHILIFHWNVMLSNGYFDHHNCVSFDRGNNLDYRKKNSFFFNIKIIFNR